MHWFRKPADPKGSREFESPPLRTMSKISTATTHTIPTDLRKILASDKTMLEAWNDITPLARNEWVCWVTSVKKEETRKDHIRRIREELKEGKRRPCCWAGCPHR